jgi:GTP-binding protein Era
VLGRPSVGKSTLINQVCGEKVAIVSPVPQTTRNVIRGIVNREQGQLVFVDTPGRHSSDKKFNKRLMELSARALDESDLNLYVLDLTRPPGIEEIEIARLLAPFAGKTVAALNKIDAPGADRKGTGEFLAKNLPGLACQFEISAKNNVGLEPLLAALFALAPEGEAFYGSEYYTDQEVEFRITEIIREQAILRLRDELPHALYVEVADAEFRGENKSHLWVRAFIVVERESQKGMVVGKGGELIKAIRLSALKELRKIFDWTIELDLRVKTGKDWRHNDRLLKKITR